MVSSDKGSSEFLVGRLPFTNALGGLALRLAASVTRLADVEARR